MKKKKFIPEHETYEEYMDALQAKRAAEQNFQWATNPEDIELAIKELRLAELRIEYTHQRVKQIDTPEKRKNFSLFRAMSF